MAKEISTKKHKYLPDLRQDERVYFVLRRHWMAITRHFTLLVFEGVIPLGLFAYYSLVSGYGFGIDDTITILAILFTSVYYLFIWLFFFYHWIDYYLDVWVVTDQRIVNIVQSGLFSRTISELNVVQVQDVTSSVKGSMATFLNYGQVFIQTAAEKPRFVFEQIPNPRQVATEIVHLHNAAVEKHPEYQVGEVMPDNQSVANQQAVLKKESPRIISPRHEDQ